MTTITELNIPNVTLEDWLNIETSKYITTLRSAYQRSELLEDRNALRHFEKHLKDKVFGTTLVCRLEKFDKFFDKSGVEKLVIDAIVMQPTEKGYVSCQHPFDSSKLWYISSIIQASHFKGNLNKGILFFASYKAAYDKKHLSDLITVDLSTYKEVQLSFTELLHDFGGETLLSSAEALFGTDIEKVIAERFLLASSESAKKLLEKEEKQVAKKRMELIKQEKMYNQRLSNLQTNEEKYKRRLTTLNDNERKWKNILERINEIIYLEEDFDFKDDVEKEVHKWNNLTIVKLLQALFYHNSEDELIYDESIIETFLRGLQANILIILNGPSGTGKSSLVAAMANAIKGAKARLIPVQSSWTDTQDLLGYFNPLEQRFVASPFLEALADAKEDEEHLYLICLDEMNLAHVEYYFSEFLSAREQKEPAIRLYSKRYFSDACALVESSLRNGEVNQKVKEQYRNAAELVNRYPYMFKIPKNVRFIGTLNMDHTVKPLSPKVIDRSLVIELNYSDRNRDIEKELSENVQTGWIDVELNQFTKQIQQNKDVEEEAKLITELAFKLDSIPNVRINSRGYKQLVQYLTRIPSIEPYHIDQLIYSKLLPRITVSIRGESELNMLKTFTNQLIFYPRSYKKLQSMLKGTRTVHFW
ncbi:5-methylcytosine-specific restriction related enzyme (plasmid) [Priestia megaterium]|uniref:McrB family protein n=1 Tax=Priestia megaterium TaxID=1404 RepID=UPI0015DC7113|nr:AAA family ATPase [Priestia megaterium]QLK09358.1 5-methylcytosine-specific restriction related enzyme [Priestia megaterium]